MRDVVVLLMETIQQVPASVKQLQPFSAQFPTSVWRRLNSSVKVQSISVLCYLDDSLAESVQHVNAQLPDCGTDSWPAGSRTTSSSVQPDPILMLSNSLVDMVESLEVARCIALAHAHPQTTSYQTSSEILV